MFGNHFTPCWRSSESFYINIKGFSDTSSGLLNKFMYPPVLKSFKLLFIFRCLGSLSYLRLVFFALLLTWFRVVIVQWILSNICWAEFNQSPFFCTICMSPVSILTVVWRPVLAILRFTRSSHFYSKIFTSTLKVRIVYRIYFDIQFYRIWTEKDKKG